jgi:hypothetical protein
MNTSRKRSERPKLLTVPLDEDTDARLRRLAVICGDEPVILAAALLRDILLEDELMHVTLN